MPSRRGRSAATAGRPASGGAEDAEVAALERTWSRPPGFLGWIASTDHKEIGLRFVVTAFAFFVISGVLALLMRMQLARPESSLLGPDLYNQFFTTHGSTMMFLFAVPVMMGMGLYLVPPMVGTRNVAFPRLMAFSYYLYLIAGVLLYVGLVLNVGPDMGWFSYVPLAGPDYGPGKRVDIWNQMVTMVEISSLVAAVEIITTTFRLRAPGMSLNRIPLFVWAQVITAIMIVFAMPAVMTCSTMLATDRLTQVNTHFFNPAEGGDPLLWQHLFWYFAHPEVYIIFIPAVGFVSTILATFCRRPTFGYTALVLSNVATAFIGFGVWVHHMFATPLPQLGQGLFTGASLMITIPNGVQMFCWIATLWGGRPTIRLPMAFVLGFIAIFMIGGLTGVMLASVSIDLQVHDTYFVVAHLHHVLIGGSVFPLFGAFYYWFPKVTGRMLGERSGWWNFWLLFLGFNLTFFPMHLLGLKGMPRRVYTYRADAGWGDMNLLATIGAFLFAAGVLVFLINVYRSRRRGRLAGPDPWGAGTLEWATASPLPPYNFAALPTVRSLYPLWQDPPDTPVVTGLSATERELLITSAQDAEPQIRYHAAGDSYWPPVLAIAVGGSLIGFIFHPVAIPVGGAVVFLVLLGWFWPTNEPKPIHHHDPEEESPEGYRRLDPPEDPLSGSHDVEVPGEEQEP